MLVPREEVLEQFPNLGSIGFLGRLRRPDFEHDARAPQSAQRVIVGIKGIKNSVLEVGAARLAIVFAETDNQDHDFAVPVCRRIDVCRPRGVDVRGDASSTMRCAARRPQ